MLLSYRTRPDGPRCVDNATVSEENGHVDIIMPGGRILDVASYIIGDYHVVSATDEELDALAESMAAYEPPATVAAKVLRSIPSKARSAASRANGRLGGRPRRTPAA